MVQASKGYLCSLCCSPVDDDLLTCSSCILSRFDRQSCTEGDYELGVHALIRSRELENQARVYEEFRTELALEARALSLPPPEHPFLDVDGAISDLDEPPSPTTASPTNTDSTNLLSAPSLTGAASAAADASPLVDSAAAADAPLAAVGLSAVAAATAHAAAATRRARPTPCSSRHTATTGTRPCPSCSNVKATTQNS